MTTDIPWMGVAELASYVRSRTLSPVEIVDALIGRIGAVDPPISAFITRTFDLARSQARRADAEIAAGRYRGPLHGIPFGLKDVVDTKDILTSGHSCVCNDRVPGCGPVFDYSPEIKRP